MFHNIELQEEAKIEASNVDAGCKIGKGTKILNCIVGQDVTIGENCILKDTVIGNNSKIGNQVHVDG